MSLMDSNFTDTEYQNFFSSKIYTSVASAFFAPNVFYDITIQENRGGYFARYIYGAAEFMVSFMLGNEHLCHNW